MMDPSPVLGVFPRQTSAAASSGSGSYGQVSSDGNGECTGNTFLCLIASPFSSQIQSRAFVSAIAFSLILTAAITVAFCFIRPYNNVVYAPRAKYADSKHAPPPIQKGLFGWVTAVVKTTENDLVEKVGLDAAIFMRFIRMMRNMFIALSILGCAVLIPITLINSSSEVSFFTRLTPQYIYGGPIFWAYVVMAYLFDAIVFYFLWTNYRHVLRLRRAYFDSPEYQKSLHSRTLLLTDVPVQSRTDDGLVKITEQVRATESSPRAAIARNVRELPDLVEEHEKAVRKLEKYLAEYLKNPNHLPAKRPTCKVSKQDKSQQPGKEVDAIEYLTARIKNLEEEIKEVRLSVDKRNPMPYGFASYDSIPDAHSVAFAARKKGTAEKAIIRLAPKPQYLLWNNLPMLKKQRDWQNFINNLWIALLTVAWIVPNVLLSVFISNLSNLGLVWSDFKTTLYAHQTFWSIVQGVVSPAITTSFYYFLPAIFRKLVTKSGDVTRTDREHHVLQKLFSFFIFNNLVVFSLFSAVWGFIAALISANGQGGSVWDEIKENNPFSAIIKTLISVTGYWCAWLLQRNLGAAIDLGQLVSLVWGTFSRRFLNPTPRELIELTAPQPFQYAAYYNYFLFYAAVALCFGGLQPLTLVITALYFSMDSFAKKYMILYIFITKYESGGMFWIALFNRVLIAAGLGNLVIACLVSAGNQSGDWIAMLACMAPLPFLIGGFKWYCMKQFDDQIRYYSLGRALADDALVAKDGEQKSRKRDRVGVRFGHPALFKPLMTPMVSAKSQHLLAQVYTGRTSLDETGKATGFSDVYMDTMDSRQLGKTTAAAAPFEIVGDHQLDYAYWKDKPEFRDEAGGDGTLFGHPPDMSRPGTPSTIFSRTTGGGMYDSSPGSSRPETRDAYSKFNPHGRADSRDSDITRVDDYAENVGVEYPKGYHPTPSIRQQSPARPDYSRSASTDPLVSAAARMARSPTPSRVPVGSRGMGVGGNAYHGHSLSLVSTPGVETPYSEVGGEDTSYDYFRRGRQA